MPARRSTGKRLRFEVFKRDHFTCQYCGAQPPAVVLVAGHVIPVKDGGQTTIDNLVTACEPCNQGKADRLITTKAIRPDADLLYLQTQQEIAELQRYQEAKAQRDAEIAQIVALLHDDWLALSALDWVPSEATIRQLLAKYSPEIVERAMEDVAIKVGTGYLPSHGNRWVRYLFTVASTLSRENEYVLDEPDPQE